jgi:acetyl-CoA carboxylase carboxyl transferase subunit beta
MSWVDQKWPLPGFKAVQTQEQSAVLSNYANCLSCGSVLLKTDFEAAHKVCSVCQHHHVLTAHERLLLLADSAPLEFFGDHLQSRDCLQFSDTMPYAKRLQDAQSRTGLTEAVVTAAIEIAGRAVIVSVFDFRFIGGSLGEVAGARVALGIQAAIERSCPFICVTASGGARMQEGLLSLMQMAKMTTAVRRLKQTRLPFINLLTHPTFGGVSASIAMQADIILAEQGAHIGFTGARVIANAMPQALPEGFQTAEFLCEHGCIDAVVARSELRGYLSRLLHKLLCNQK